MHSNRIKRNMGRIGGLGMLEEISYLRSASRCWSSSSADFAVASTLLVFPVSVSTRCFDTCGCVSVLRCATAV